MTRVLVISLTLAIAATVTASAQPPPYTVNWVGAQRDLMTGDLSPHITLESLAGLPHLYAVGPLDNLRGEITIWDSRPSVARVVDDRIVIDRSYQHRAPFLVWVQVERWHARPMPAITGVAGLERFVATEAERAGLDVNQPFPFLITGRMTHIALHILDKRDGLPHNPDLHERAKVKRVLTDTDASIIGFYSNKHRGIFTPAHSSVHMHVRTEDERTSGHVDDIQIFGDARLHLPRVR